ncbi:MAG: cytidylate kinase-like family protein [Chloroflexi bacterium]|nr:cytidylate kinase-like family protein [Chloroflexota bacterium]
MASKAVSISRTLGAHGEEVGRLVATELAFRYVDNEIINQAADRAGVSPEAVASNEKTQPLLTRILEAISKAPLEPEMMVAQAEHPVNLTSAYEDLIEQAVVETAQQGNVVILAHGASIPLAKVEHVLRVLVTASTSTRIERVAADQDLDSKQAEKTVEESDKERERYFERIYELNRELPTHYDLVVNTDVLSAEQAARIISSAASVS